MQDYIDTKDLEWTNSNGITPFMSSLLNSEASSFLDGIIDFHKGHDHDQYGKIFATNKYGAVVALTRKTSDYRQDDEKWWQEAKKNGLYIADVNYIESVGMYSVDVSIRVDDENGNFLGVQKASINIEEVILIIKELDSTHIDGMGEGATGLDWHAEHETMEFKLLTKDGRLIYSTKDEYDLFEDISELLPLGIIAAPGTEGHDDFFVAAGFESDEGEELYTHAHSTGYRSYTGLGWILVLEHETEDIFAPLIQTRQEMFMGLITLSLFSIIFGILISYSITRPINKLTKVIEDISVGKIDTEFDPALKESNDETGKLAQAFDRTMVSLKLAMRQTAPELKKESDKLRELINEKESAEKEIKILSTAVEQSSEGMAIADLKGNLTFANDAWCKMHGYTSSKQLIGKSLAIFHNKEQLQNDVVPFNEKVKEHGTHAGEVGHITKDGQPFQTLMTTTQLKDEHGQPFAMVGIARDIPDKTDK